MGSERNARHASHARHASGSKKISGAQAELDSSARLPERAQITVVFSLQPQAGALYERANERMSGLPPGQARTCQLYWRDGNTAPLAPILHLLDHRKRQQGILLSGGAEEDTEVGDKDGTRIARAIAIG